MTSLSTPGVFFPFHLTVTSNAERVGDRRGHLPEGFRLTQFVQPRVALSFVIVPSKIAYITVEMSA
jgi:hypothetical protein